MIAAIVEILPKVTSPLALAALLLLVGGGLLRAIAKGKDRAGLRSALRWVFGSAIAMGALANISFMASARLNSETRIAGKVTDTTGTPLASVIVELVGTGARGITTDDGNFDFNLPSSRRSFNYEVRAHLAGYTPFTDLVGGPKPPERLSIQLVKPQLDPELIFTSHSPNRAMHQLGIPFLDLSLGITNPLPWTVDYKRLTLILKGPSGNDGRTLQGNGSFVPGTQQYVPVMFISEGRLESGSESRLTQRYFAWTERPDELIYRATLEANQSSQNSTEPISLSADLVDDLRGFFDRVWFWKAGTWTVEVSALFDGREISREFKFQLSQSQINRMRSVAQRFGSGMGILPDRPFPPESVANIEIR